MPNITIKESDLTLVSQNVSSRDVVFIPGFVSQDTVPTNIPERGVPVYCATLSDFESVFGSVYPIFSTDQKYTASKWATNAVPDGGIIRTAGSVDTAYIMARQLLNLGLPIIYCRVNSNSNY